ncbi:MAG: hypothetical protein M1542_07575 [Thermotogae bacterium]|jgi:hypothetical protein|nr:hypothetical protein [Thermotogota bacterium]MCL5033084.1 hypothetical protein [Thermotogota bacterium]
MALSGTQVGIKVGTANAGLVSSVKPSAKTNSITRSGIGGFTKNKITNHNYEFGWEGDFVDASVLKIALPVNGIPPEIDITIHDLKYAGAHITKMSIKGDQDSTLTYSATAIAKGGSKVDAVIPVDPGMFLVFRDATITFGTSTAKITAFTIDISTKATPIYGTSIDPTDFQFGATEYSGSFTIVPDTSLEEVLKGAGDGTPYTFSIAGTGFNISGSGVITTESAGQIKADGDVTIVHSIKADSITIS